MSPILKYIIKNVITNEIVYVKDVAKAIPIKPIFAVFASRKHNTILINRDMIAHAADCFTIFWAYKALTIKVYADKPIMPIQYTFMS